MRADNTIHFPHPLTHPSVVYAPTHLVDHAIPVWAKLAFLLAVIVGVWTLFAVGFKKRRVGLVTAIATCVLLGCAEIGNITKGQYVGPLPTQNHGLAPSTYGDQPELYVKRADALAAAKEVSKDQDKPSSTARATAYAWGKWPSTALNTTHPPFGIDDFPRDAEWTKEDAVKIDDWVFDNYLVTPGSPSAANEDYPHFGVRAPDGYQLEVDGDTVAEVDGYDLGLQNADENKQMFACSVQMSALKLNDLSQPVSATPKQLVCILKDQQGSAHPHLYYPAKKH